MWHKFTYHHTSPVIPLKLALEFGPAYIAAGNPPDYAVLIRKEPGGKESTLFFPPSAANLLVFCPGAVPCNKPTYTEITVFHGEKSALFALFPEQ